ncbi:MAG: SO_0444 family Cu/Zn efflux transporter [Planctomycetota bacterium]
MDLTALEIAALLFVASLIGALLPLYRRWSDRGLHVFVALAAGIFLGTIFLHLLPHLAGVEGDGHAHAAEAGEPGLLPWVAALLGLLILFAIERVWLPSWTRSASADPHTGLWVATFVGLSLHAVTAGVALTAILADPTARTQFLVSILIHKATETFSLATVMRLANLGRPRTIALLLFFAAIEPAGLLFGSGLLGFGHGIDSVLLGLACGTFLYVAVCDLLPEVFHGRERPGVKLFAVVVGVGISALSLEGLADVFGFAHRVLDASVAIFVDFAPFLLLGFLVAGVLSQVLRTQRFTKYLKGDDLKSVGAAALVGAPLPLCSCAVVPVAVELRRAGASKGATSSFLIATPETGIDSVTVTWALLDPVMTIARPIGAVLSAVFTGAVVNLFVKSGNDVATVPTETGPAEDACCAPTVRAETPSPVVRIARAAGATGAALTRAEGPACCAAEVHGAAHELARGHTPVHAHGAESVHVHGHSHAHGHVHAHSHGPVHAHGHDTAREHGHSHALGAEPTSTAPAPRAAVAPPRSLLGRVLHHAFVEMLDDLSISLLLGTLISGLIAVLVPADLFAHSAAQGLSGMLLMLLIGIPMYVCAAASTPIAATLILKGMSPGAAFVFLLASPATNLGSLFALRKHLGGRVVAVHVVALAVVTLLLGCAVDAVYSALELAPRAQVGAAHEHGVGVGVVAAVVLALLMLVSLVRTHGARDLLAKLRTLPEPEPR